MRRSQEDQQRNHTSTVNDLRNQIAPLERRLQEVTRALVQAKENETEAVKQAQEQAKIGKEVSVGCSFVVPLFPAPCTTRKMNF